MSNSYTNHPQSSPMRMGDRNVYRVSLNGRTVQVEASSEAEARKYLGPSGAYARVEKIQTQRW